MTDRCRYGDHGGIVPCSVHGPLADECARDAARRDDAASAAGGLSWKQAERSSYGASYAAYQAALIRPHEPCADGSCGLGWPDAEEET